MLLAFPRAVLQILLCCLIEENEGIAASRRQLRGVMGAPPARVMKLGFAHTQFYSKMPQEVYAEFLFPLDSLATAHGFEP